MTPARRWRASVCGALAGLLILTACGSSTGSGSTTTSDQSAGLTGSPIKIGLVASKTGFNSAQAGPTADTADAWARWVNSSGGIDGHPVQVLLRDSAATPATGQSVVKDLVENQDVSAVMVNDVSVEAAVSDYLQSHNVPVIESLGYDVTSWGVRPNYFMTATTDTVMQASYAISAADAHAKAISLAACAEAPNCVQAGMTVQQAAPSLGVTYNGLVKVSASQPSFTAECLNFIQKKTDFIAMALVFAGTGTRMVKDCLQQGYSGTFGVSSGSVIGATLDEIPGAKYNGALNAFPWWVDAPAVRQYRDVMAKYAPKVDMRNVWLTATWTGLQLFRKAVTGKAANGVTRQQVLEAYGSIKDETLDGLLAQPITFTAGKPAPRQPCFWIYSYNGGTGTPAAHQEGRNGNGATGGLASSCYDGNAG